MGVMFGIACKKIDLELLFYSQINVLIYFLRNNFSVTLHNMMLINLPKLPFLLSVKTHSEINVDVTPCFLVDK